MGIAEDDNQRRLNHVTETLNSYKNFKNKSVFQFIMLKMSILVRN